MYYTKIGRPGAIGSRKKEVYQNYDKFYGKNNWSLNWQLNHRSINLPEALMLYEDAYFEHFKNNPEELKWIVDNFSDVYDNHKSNIFSGTDYSKQEFGGSHFQDIAIRRCLIRNGLHFKGFNNLLEIRMSEPGVKWNPGKIPFHKPELISQPELKGFWEPGSVESFYQSNRFLEVKYFDLNFFDKDLYFVTSNKGKFESAQRSLGDLISLGQIKLDIREDQKTVEEISIHKARVAYSVLCRPIICDDSGLVIPSKGEWPGSRVDREIKRLGEQGFADLFKEKPLEAYFKMVVTYFDETMEKPKNFISKVSGHLQYEAKGDPNKPFLKNKVLGTRFVVEGQSKTLAEMSEEEYKQDATTNRWKELADFIKNK